MLGLAWWIGKNRRHDLLERILESIFSKSPENTFYNSCTAYHFTNSPTPAAGCAGHLWFLSVFLAVIAITVTSISQCHSSCCQKKHRKVTQANFGIAVSTWPKTCMYTEGTITMFHRKCYLVDSTSTTEWLGRLFPNRIVLQ